MIIIGESLKQLSVQHKMVDNPKSFDNTCLTLHLGNKIIRLLPTDEIDTLTYTYSIPQECIRETNIETQDLILEPGEAVLASSIETVNMPVGYMGFIQTKGSLARLFVSVHFSDGQIDTGFKGKVTLEIFNASKFKIRLLKNSPVANLYVFKASSKDCPPYNGKYLNADGPTVQV